VEVPDSIELEVILPVPPTRVWTALTQPDRPRSASHHSTLKPHRTRMALHSEAMLCS